MSELGEIYAEQRARSQAKRAKNRHASTQLLLDEGVDFEYKNNGAHLIVFGLRNERLSAIIDFWPGTGKWIERNTQLMGRGVKPLLKHIKKRNN